MWIVTVRDYLEESELHFLTCEAAFYKVKYYKDLGKKVFLKYTGR